MTDIEFKYYFDEHSGGLVCFAKKLVGELLAEDIVADAFLKLWEHGDHNDPKGFLKTCIKNDCLNELKHGKVVRKFERLVVDTSPGYIEAIEVKSELIERIIKELKSLSPVQKKIAAYLKYGFTKPEIAQILNISQDTVRVHVFRIRGKLKPLRGL